MLSKLACYQREENAVLVYTLFRTVWNGTLLLESHTEVGTSETKNLTHCPDNSPISSLSLGNNSTDITMKLIRYLPRLYLKL